MGAVDVRVGAGRDEPFGINLSLWRRMQVRMTNGHQRDSLIGRTLHEHLYRNTHRWACVVNLSMIETMCVCVSVTPLLPNEGHKSLQPDILWQTTQQQLFIKTMLPPRLNKLLF